MIIMGSYNKIKINLMDVSLLKGLGSVFGHKFLSY